MQQLNRLFHNRYNNNHITNRDHHKIVEVEEMAHLTLKRHITNFSNL
jgi:hypothetical protein